MYMTGFADEAGKSIEEQIRATLELGWKNIEARNVDGVQFHDLPEDKFKAACDKLGEAGVHINCFGSAIANWGKKIDEPFDSSLQEAERSIDRMLRLGTKLVRIMSFAVLKDRGPEDQMEEERFRRLRRLVSMFTEAGLTPVHENCMNYGGMGWPFTLRLMENVPGLKLVYDTGNPVQSADMSKDAPYPRQSSWEFYSHVRDHVAYIHIKDGIWKEDEQKAVWTFPGEGQGDVARITADLMSRGYDGGISIEPHIAVVYHEGDKATEEEKRYATYVEYGRRMMKIIEEVKPT